MSTTTVLTKKGMPEPDAQMKAKSALSRSARPQRTSKASTSSLLHRTGKEPLSQHDLDLLAKLRQLPDREINFSDVPDTKVNTFANRSDILSLFKPYKLQITLRLDADIIAWARRDGEGYQSRINASLRKVMMDDLKAAKKKRT